MSIVKVKEYFRQYGRENDVLEFEVSSATVALAALALGCKESEIAKTLSFRLKDSVILIVMAGDYKIDNSKFKGIFGEKAVMLKFYEVEPAIGHAVGGVCPFAINEGVDVYLDNSLKEHNFVYPACGSANSAIKLTLEELENYSKGSWIDITKKIEPII
ncbi:MAG: YbaK/EbsC family protein [Clostridia bacterium]|nr:YbaK/EbsC family protein [Clostridia bacterium]